MSTISPELFIADIKVQWDQLSPTEKRRLAEHARAHATNWYFGNIPNTTEESLQNLEAQCR